MAAPKVNLQILKEAKKVSPMKKRKVQGTSSKVAPKGKSAKERVLQCSGDASEQSPSGFNLGPSTSKSKHTAPPSSAESSSSKKEKKGPSHVLKKSVKLVSTSPFKVTTFPGGRHTPQDAESRDSNGSKKMDAESHITGKEQLIGETSGEQQGMEFKETSTAPLVVPSQDISNEDSNNNVLDEDCVMSVLVEKESHVKSLSFNSPAKEKPKSKGNYNVKTELMP